MKAVLISIKPKYCDLIADGKKTVEVRKTKPKIKTPFKVYIYETQGRTETPWVDEDGHEIFKGRGQVIGEFVCDKIDNIEIRHFTVFGHENIYTAIGENPDYQWLKHSCLEYNEVVQYGKLAPLYGWHISNLVIYDEPKELSEFEKPHDYIYQSYRKKNSFFKGITRPPQSWCYVEV